MRALRPGSLKVANGAASDLDQVSVDMTAMFLSHQDSGDKIFFGAGCGMVVGPFFR